MLSHPAVSYPVSYSVSHPAQTKKFNSKSNKLTESKNREEKEGIEGHGIIYRMLNVRPHSASLSGCHDVISMRFFSSISAGFSEERTDD